MRLMKINTERVGFFFNFIESLVLMVTFQFSGYFIMWCNIFWNFKLRNHQTLRALMIELLFFHNIFVIFRRLLITWESQKGLFLLDMFFLSRYRILSCLIVLYFVPCILFCLLSHFNYIDVTQIVFCLVISRLRVMWSLNNDVLSALPALETIIDSFLKVPKTSVWNCCRYFIPKHCCTRYNTFEALKFYMRLHSTLFFFVLFLYSHW